MKRLVGNAYLVGIGEGERDLQLIVAFAEPGASANLRPHQASRILDTLQRGLITARHWAGIQILGERGIHLLSRRTSDTMRSGVSTAPLRKYLRAASPSALVPEEPTTPLYIHPGPGTVSYTHLTLPTIYSV